MPRLRFLLPWLLGFSAACADAGGIDFTPTGSQPRLQVRLIEPDNCAGCHASVEPNEDLLMPHSTWAGSMMANATRDPLFWAALDVANHDVPGVGDFCLRCHAPVAWYGGRVRKTGVPASPTVNGENGCRLTGSLIDQDHGNNDYAGLSCHFCHRADDVGPQGQATMIGNGRLWVDDATSCSTATGNHAGPCRKGPYRYAPGAATGPPPHGWEHSRYLGSSEFCGSCHDVSTPDTSAGPLKTLKLADGSDSGLPFPIERTFGEWRASAYADPLFADGFDGSAPTLPNAVGPDRSCQDCHMRKSADPLARACVMEAPGSRAGQLPVHEFTGANYWVPRILRDEYGIGRAGAYDRTIGWAEQTLSQRTASVETAITAFAGAGSPLQLRVRVTNRAGHKLPTGYAEGRRMWLHLRVHDGDGNTIFESGAYDSNTGALARDPQLRLYEALQGQWNRNGDDRCDVADGNGRELFHFALNDCIAVDNRIPPQGFRGGNDLALRPVGREYPETSPGVLAHWDDASYTVPVDAATPMPLTVTATLRFQIASREYIQFLRDEAANNAFPSENQMCGRNEVYGPANLSRGQFMHDLWQEYGRAAPFDIATDTASTGGSP